MIEGGFIQFDKTPEMTAWAKAANAAADAVLADPAQQAKWLRHGQTWFVGVDALPTDEKGAIDGVPLRGPWDGMVPGLPLHPAQLSVIYKGYPRKDADESDKAHKYRLARDAAHLDGLLAEGPEKRRHLREPHAYITAVAVNDCTQAPLVVWPGSEEIMREAFTVAFAGMPPSMWPDIDVTEIYADARAEVFECCERVELPMTAGQSVLLDRMVIHGTAPDAKNKVPAAGRRMAFFRPQFDNFRDWLRD
ncbi:hypothetical protein BVC71_03800 [Marivivens niveibacter]|uniref:Phytanoyl-CoA dioxygenase n=1 Tax=Marivivens niveibacter TaxID=1930667 RepID=A0A251X201_9RHOB|nr:hypothetical protein [Marivivens niveibacter]OUD10626.1 hypothetical protein BVC71_03800 [Marivivens niveibacter]